MVVADLVAVDPTAGQLVVVQMMMMMMMMNECTLTWRES